MIKTVILLRATFVATVAHALGDRLEVGSDIGSDDAEMFIRHGIAEDISDESPDADAMTAPLTRSEKKAAALQALADQPVIDPPVA